MIMLGMKEIRFKVVKKAQVEEYNALIDALNSFVTKHGEGYNFELPVPDKIQRQELLSLPPEQASELFETRSLRAIRVAFAIGLTMCQVWGLWFEFSLSAKDPHIKFYANAIWEDHRFIGVEDEAVFSKLKTYSSHTKATIHALEVYSSYLDQQK